ncbi:MAG: peptide/nickel transport system permease protein, partial [Actinomycetota bacterium]|nr:peptide/nickel transport system permease protein [Actinomycetota bacterium]
MSIEASTQSHKDPRGSWFQRLPVVSHFNKSVGLQRGMLVAGLVLTVLFLVTAVFAPLIAPFGFAQISDADGSFPAQQAPGGNHLMGTTAGGYDVFSRVAWGAQTAILVIVVA